MEAESAYVGGTAQTRGLRDVQKGRVTGARSKLELKRKQIVL